MGLSEPFAGLAAGSTKFGAGVGAGLAGGRQAVFNQRVMNAAKEASTDLKNISELPVGASTGFLGLGGTSPTTIWNMSKHALMQEMSAQDVQSYNTESAGINRYAAIAEGAGLAPSQTLTNQAGAQLTWQPGETYHTRLLKLAQTRQIFEQALISTLASTGINDQQRVLAQQIIDDMAQTIPYTVHDVNALTAKGGSGDSVSKFAVRSGLPKAQPRASTPAGALGLTPHQINSDAEYNALPSGTEFLAPDGSHRKKP
jgi:hypothetical protein